MAKVLCFVVVLELIGALVNAGLCPGETQSFTESRCLEVTTDGSSTFTQASSSCEDDNLGGLATVTTNGELSTIKSYVSALGSDSESYWVGYQYDGSQLEDIAGNLAPSLVTAEVDSNGLTEATGVCVAVGGDGVFRRTSCSEMLGRVCLFSLTDPSVSIITVNDNVTMGAETVSIGSNVTLNCTITGTTPTSTVQWTVNDIPLTDGVTTSSDMGSTELLISPFMQCGEYKCSVTNTDGQTSFGTVQLFGDIENIIAAPSPVDTFGSIPESQSSLFLRWTQPERTYVISPLLVSYTLYYSTDRILNYTSSPSIIDLRVDSDGVGTYVLGALQPGTRYYLGMRAENRAGTSEQASVTQVVTTFGNAPTSPPNDLSLRRNVQNTALLAEWEAIAPSLPTGTISFYRVEFRDTREIGESTDISVLFIDSRFSAASIFNVREAQGYEVRVAGAVQSQRDPVEYDLGPLSDWVAVDGIAPEIPIIPTLQPVADDNSAVVIVSTVVPIVVVSVLVVMLVVLIAIWISRKSGKGNDQADGGNKLCHKCRSNPISSEKDQMELEETEG